ncbi:ABC transporter permease [Paraflavitalea pollutisoli]|uniref:ABC transporter permease n=1 Tax=Paraflavitalea pollutisoli TaxID=3034143 RepID=UPI0023EC9FB8|nr:ABC transporter permease [Paraflavitalea sp. H1-2-19X]
MAADPGTNDHWEWEIDHRARWGIVDLRQLWSFRHLLGRLIRREFLVNYQQTMLGPLWVVLQPVLTLVVYVLVFGRWMAVDTGTVPPVLFFLSGILLWGLCNDLFTGTAFIFTHYSYLFTKVYFPRVIIPLSIGGTHLARFAIQFFLLIGVLFFYGITGRFEFAFNAWLFFVLPAVLLTAAFSLAMGLIFSIATARYRDLSNIVHLGIRLAMFITPVIYPAAMVPEGLRWLVRINPLSAVFEVFRYGLLGQGLFTPGDLIYSVVFITLFLLFALAWFNKLAAKLIDVV